MSQPRICVIIPSFNRRELLHECIQAVLSQTRRPDAVMVLDNASSDGSAEMVTREFPQVELMVNAENTGSAGGFSQGIRWGYEKGFDWLWLLDNDAIPAPDCLERLLEAKTKLEQQQLRPSALGSLALWTDGRNHPMNGALPDWYRFNHLSGLMAQGIHAKLWVTWVSVLLPRWAIQLNGLPHSDFFTWNEDMEYMLRFSRRGVCAIVMDSKVVHKTNTPYTPASAVGPRFYYEVRNKIWVLRGSTFRPLEKLWLLGCTIGNIVGYLRHNPRNGWSIVRKGLQDGLGSRPDPELTKLS